MKLGIAVDERGASEPKWHVFDMEGYEANTREPEDKQIRFLIRPQTRNSIDRVEKQVASQLKARGRSKYDKVETGEPEGAGDRGDLFARANAKYHLLDWTNVCDLDGNPLECTDRNKVWLFENINVAFWIVMKASEGAVVAIEDERENSQA